MDYKWNISVTFIMSILLAGCNTNPAILDGVLKGALGQIVNSAGLSTNASNSSDFLSPGAVRKKCHYFDKKKCGSDFGSLAVTTVINRNNLTLVRYGNLIEKASGGKLKVSSVASQMFPHIDRGFIDFDSPYFVRDSAKAIRPGSYYFKGSYGGQNPSLAVGSIEIKAGVTNIINAVYD